MLIHARYPVAFGATLLFAWLFAGPVPLVGPAPAQAQEYHLCLLQDYGQDTEVRLHTPVDVATDRRGQAWVLTQGDCQLRPLLPGGAVGASLSAGCGGASHQLLEPSALFSPGIELTVLGRESAYRFHPNVGPLGQTELDGPSPAGGLQAGERAFARAADQPDRLLIVDASRGQTRIFWTGGDHAWLQAVRVSAGDIWVLDHQRADLHRLDALGQVLRTWELGEHRGRLKEQGRVTVSNPAVGAAAWAEGEGLLIALAEDLHGDRKRELRLYRPPFIHYERVAVREGIIGGRMLRTSDNRLWVVNAEGHRVQAVALHGPGIPCPNP